MATSPLNVPIPAIDELTQNNVRLLQQSLADAAQVASPDAPAAAELALARSNTRALSFVLGLGLHGVYRFLRDKIAPQAIPIKASKTFLDGWLDTYGLPRKGASHAFGAATGSGVAGVTLAAGTLLQRADGAQYKTTADATVASDGTLGVQLVALVPGLAGNAAARTRLELVSPVGGVDTGFVADAASGVSGGADVETDAEAIYRLQQRLSNEPMGGSPADYARWALQVPGITRAWGVRNPAGATRAGVFIMADGMENEDFQTALDVKEQASPETVMAEAESSKKNVEAILKGGDLYNVDGKDKKRKKSHDLWPAVLMVFLLLVAGGALYALDPLGWRSEQPVAATPPAAENDTAQQPPAPADDTAQQSPASENDTARQPPATENDTAQQPPAPASENLITDPEALTNITLLDVKQYYVIEMKDFIM